MAITGKSLGKKALFFDSNDDMLSEHEILKRAQNGHGNDYNLQRISININDEERMRRKDKILKQKKHRI